MDTATVPTSDEILACIYEVTGFSPENVTPGVLREMAYNMGRQTCEDVVMPPLRSVHDSVILAIHKDEETDPEGFEPFPCEDGWVINGPALLRYLAERLDEIRIKESDRT